VALLVVAFLAGCQSSSRKAYSDNPLLATRQPLIHTQAQREKAAASAQVAAAPVLPPPVPLPSNPSALVQNPPNQPPPPSWDITSGAEQSDAPPPALAPLPARTMADELGHGIIPAAISAPPSSASRIVNGQYGYATDHSWLQGELDRHYRGFLDLRYRPASEEDTFGGKVRLEDDPRLAEFRAGDIIAVEGELIRDADTSMGQYPRYRIKSVRLIERKN
jgi:hypothetical protein